MYIWEQINDLWLHNIIIFEMKLLNYLNFGSSRWQPLENVSPESRDSRIGDSDSSSDEQFGNVEFVTASRKIFAATRVRIFCQKFGKYRHLGLLVSITK